MIAKASLVSRMNFFPRISFDNEIFARDSGWQSVRFVVARVSVCSFRRAESGRGAEGGEEEKRSTQHGP